MADTNRLRLVIETDNRSANAGFAQTNQVMDKMALHAIQIARSIANQFTIMAAEIRAAISGLSGSFAGLNANAGLVNQYGRPVYSGQPVNGGVSPGVVAGTYGNRAPRQSYRQMNSEGSMAGPQSQLYDEHYGAWGHPYKTGFFDRGEEATANRKFNKNWEYMLRENDKLTESLGNTGNSMAGGMLKAIAYYEILRRGGMLLKSLTSDSALYAAHVMQLQGAMVTVAGSNGISKGTATAVAARVHQLGVTTEESYSSTTQMMAVGMGTKSTVPLAELAQNIGRVRGIPTANVLQNLITGAVTGRTEELHSMGIMVNAETEYRKLALSIGTTADHLTEYQKKQALANAIIREGAAYAGTYEASMGSLGGKLASMPRLIAEAKLAMGKEFQPELKAGVWAATSALKTTEENPGEVADMMRTGVLGVAAAVALLAGGWIAVTAAVIASVVGLDIVYVKTSEVVDGFKNLSNALKGSPDALKAITAELKNINAERLKEFTGPSPSVVDDLGTSIKERNFAKTRRGDMSGLSKMTGKEMAEFAIQGDVLRIKNETDWYNKQMERKRQSQKALEESRSAGLEGAYAIRSKSEVTIREQGMDKEGFQRGLEAEAASNYRMAATNEINAARTKQIRDLKREISTEEAGQLEGNYKLVALDELAIAKLKDEGNATKELITKTNDLTQAKMRTAVIEEARSARDSFERAQVSDLQGYSQIDADSQLKRDTLARKNLASPAAIDNINAEAGIKTHALARNNADALELMKRDTGKTEDQAALESIAQQRQTKLAGIERINTFDFAAKMSVEKQKYELEVHYLDLITAKKKEIREGDFNDQLTDLNKRFYRGELKQSEYDALRKERQQQLTNDLAHQGDTASLHQADLLKNTVHNQREMMQAEYTQLYDKLKGSVTSVFDAMFDKNTNMLDAMGAALRNFFKKLAIDIISTQVTKGIMTSLTGASVQTSGAGSGIINSGPVNWLQKMMGNGRTTFTGGSEVPNMVQGPTTSSLGSGFQRLLAPDGTDQLFANVRNPVMFAGFDPQTAFTNTVSDSNNGGSNNGGYGISRQARPFDPTKAVMDALKPSGGGGSTRPGGLNINPKTFADLRNTFKGTNWGSFTRASTPKAYTMSENGILLQGRTDPNTGEYVGGSDGGPGTGKINGVGGVAGAGLQMGGMMLASDGLMGPHRGTWTGVAEGTAGGAMIGFQMGGPLGAVIGGAVGFGIGIGEKIAGVESQQNQAKRLVKDIYHLSINNGMADQIVALAKQKYGNMVSVAVRSSEARQLLQLYAEQSGQKSNLFLNDPHGVNLAQSNGSLYQTATYHNGIGYSYASNLANLGNPTQQVPAGNPFGGNVTVMVSPEATTNLWTTGVANGIASSSRQVADANVRGGTASSSRIAGAGMLLSPDTVAF